jgi:hypothetical protein
MLSSLDSAKHPKPATTMETTVTANAVPINAFTKKNTIKKKSKALRLFHVVCAHAHYSKV